MLRFCVTMISTCTFRIASVYAFITVVVISTCEAAAKDHNTLDTSDEASSNCHVALGVANPGLIPFYWLHGSDGFAYRGRLDRSNAWISTKPLYPEADPTDPNSYAWLQVDLRRPTLVTGVNTQGDPVEENWVTLYSVYYSQDCETFLPVVNAKGYSIRFHGNDDQNVTITSILPYPIVSRCIRLVPLARHGNETALRMELLGCDVRMCRESVITHLKSDDAFSDVTTLTDISAPRTQIKDKYSSDGGIFTQPTLMKRGYAEFKFGAEHLVFGLVVFSDANGASREESERFKLTYSRNCHHWDAVRESRWGGDPLVFTDKGGRYGSSWHTLPYPVRAQCIRIIPVSTHYTAHSPIKAHFIGCGTGPGSSESCGVRRHVSHRVRRVIGGSVTAAGEWPWLVSLQISENPGEDYYHVCGGSLIHPQWILTAVHCIRVMYSRLYNDGNSTDFDLSSPEFRSNLKILLGKHSLISEEDTDIEAKAERIIGHPEYNMTYFIHDMALIKLTEPVRLSDHVSLVCTPDDVFSVSNDTDCRVIGWGKTGEGHLPARPHQIAVKIFKFDDCQNIFTHLNLTTDMLCAGHLDGSADACYGDSGGPMMCERDGRWYQLGTVSWNIGCATEGYPGVYSSIPEHLEWINSHLSGNVT